MKSNESQIKPYLTRPYFNQMQMIQNATSTKYKLENWKGFNCDKRQDGENAIVTCMHTSCSNRYNDRGSGLAIF